MHLLLSEYEGRLYVCPAARHRDFPSSFYKRKEQNELREALDPKLQASHSGVGTCRAPRVGRGEGAGADRGRRRGGGGREEDLVVDCCCLGFSPFGEVFVSIEKGGGQLREDAAGRAR